MQKRRRISRSKKVEVDSQKDESNEVEEDEKSRVVRAPNNKDNNKQTTWGSKQPKPIDVNILKYALTTGAELARKLNELKFKKSDDGRTDLTNEINQLRNALFIEIQEGEASLSCDKRGSLVLQNLVKEGSSDQVFEVFERLKPYVGFLAYNPCASHVLQTIVDVCSSESASSGQRAIISEFCAQISKANEWWALMHDASGTHVARSCTTALARVKDDIQLSAVFTSLASASQDDFRRAAKDSHAAPFLAVAINSLSEVEKREKLIKRLFTDERDESFNRKFFDSALQDRTCSRVFDQAIPNLSDGFVCDTIFDVGFESQILVRSAKHMFANFVVQRTIEKLSKFPSALTRAFNECKVKAMIDFDRVGVLTSLAKAISTSDQFETLQIEFCRDLIEARVLEKALQSFSIVGLPESAKDEIKNPQVNLGLAELLSSIFCHFCDRAKDPLVYQVLSLDLSVLIDLATDPVGGKKLIETVLDDPKSSHRTQLAAKFKGSFVKLLLDKFGVFVAQKSLFLLNRRDRLAVAENEIIPNKSKISANVYGRKFLSIIAISDYSKDRKAWSKNLGSGNAGKTQEKQAKDLVNELGLSSNN